MDATLPAFGPVVSLVPRTGVQVLDFGFDLGRAKVSRSFWMRPAEGGQSKLVALLPDDDDPTRLVDSEGHAPPEQEIVSWNGPRACEVFLDRWMPVPFFRIRETKPDGTHVFAAGPSNWARARLAALPAPDEQGNTHRCVIAFDTTPVESMADRAYLAPSVLDIKSGQEFALASGTSDAFWFLSQGGGAAWVTPWVAETWREWRRAKARGRTIKEEDLADAREAWALYLTFLEVLAKMPLASAERKPEEEPRLPRVRFVDTETKPRRYEPISVSLVVDVGNSRTCGILVESSRGESVDLNNSYPLAIRDLGRPERTYSDPFPSRLEFARPSFGNEQLSRRSGRADAFAWPTVARVGWEALELSSASHGTEGNTGLSTPKRYLWDTPPQNHEWRFNPADGMGGDTPVTAGAFVQLLRDDGEERGPGDLPALNARYSRSSMMTFFLAEILLHAFTLVNSPGRRYERAHAEIPRRLRQVILTMPTAMSVPERRLFKRRAELAIRMVWALMGQPADEAPLLRLQWDEATGTQLVFLYNEIMANFRGDAEAFFNISGRLRDGYGERPCLRLASIDIGGGTSDLIITTYALEGASAIRPVRAGVREGACEEFREGFNIAGDDILAAIIERCVLPGVFASMKACGVADPATLMANLFGENRGGQTEGERTLRRQFANQVALPAALKMVDLYENYEPSQGRKVVNLCYDDVFPPGDRPHPRIVEWVDRAVAECGGEGFRLERVRFEADMAAIDHAVHRTIDGVIADLCEVVRLYDCDYLVLSGRPSRMPGVLASVLSQIPVPPDRLFTMNRYRVGSWYPFRDVFGRLSDPKTTASVGAMVCALSEGFLEGFHLASRNLGMRSTARYIGEMEKSGQIKRQRVWFGDVDLDDAKGKLPQRVADFYAPVFIGFRQLDLERWPVTPLYRMDFSQPQDAARKKLPLKVAIEKLAEEDDRECKIFEVADVTDAEGGPLLKGTVVLRLQSLKNELGYWLDTGVFFTPR
jgi:hypothetical protein